jgi:uncharacterized protein (DUF2147 family)
MAIIKWSIPKRRFRMRAALVFSGLLLATTSALAADPVGEWLVQDRSARMKVVSCPDPQTQTPGIWGIIWAEKQPGVDHSRDPAMRGRPTLGIPILINMKQTKPDRWEGKIYDPQGNSFISGGGIYNANITLKQNVLEVRGCFGQFVCGGEDWTRITDPNTPPLPPASAVQPSKAPAAAKSAPATDPRATAAAVDPICANVARLVPRGS